AIGASIKAAWVGFTPPTAVDLWLLEEASTANRRGGVPAGGCVKQAMDGLRAHRLPRVASIPWLGKQLFLGATQRITATLCPRNGRERQWRARSGRRRPDPPPGCDAPHRRPRHPLLRKFRSEPDTTCPRPRRSSTP